MGKGGVIAVALGLLVMVGSAIYGVMSTASGVNEVLEMPVGVIEDGSGSVTLAADELHIIFQPEGEKFDRCSISGPDGKNVPNVEHHGTFTFEDADTAWEAFDAFETTSAGNYTVACDSDVKVGAMSVSSPGYKDLIPLVIAVAGACVGLLLLVLGIILLMAAGMRKSQPSDRRGTSL
nr:Uncharacterised protein [Streptococcus thermophilus]VDG63943.1 Uncharacterised protein [Streptococcus thermophilus]